MSDAQAKAKAMICAVYEDKEAEINGRVYCFTKMTHKQRRKVFAFYSRVAKQVEANNFSFLDSPEFVPVEETVNKTVTYEGSLLSVLGDAHWEAHAEDYLPFIGIALAAISYPFIAGSLTS